MSTTVRESNANNVVLKGDAAKSTHLTIFRGLLAVTLLLAVRASLACSCPIPLGDLAQDVRESLKSSTLVVSARVARVETLWRENNRYGLVETQKADWIVMRNWKGPYAETAVFSTETVVECCLCGRSVVLDGAYLLYLYGEPPYSISICSMSEPLDSAEPQLRVLERLKP